MSTISHLTASPSSPTHPQRWNIAFEPRFLEYKINNYLKHFIHEISISKLHSPISKESKVVVGWGQTKILSVDEARPYSEEFGPCVAFLTRGYQNSAKKASHLGLSHVFMNCDICKEHLVNMQTNFQCQKTEVFISGGHLRGSMHEEILNQIKQFNQENKGNAEIQEDLYGLADLGDFYLADGPLLHQGTCGIRSAGFDPSCNPYAIVDIQFSSYKGDFKNVQVERLG